MNEDQKYRFLRRIRESKEQEGVLVMMMSYVKMTSESAFRKKFFPCPFSDTKSFHLYLEQHNKCSFFRRIEYILSSLLTVIFFLQIYTMSACVICNKTAYPLEALKALDKTYHKLCFKCLPIFSLRLPK